MNYRNLLIYIILLAIVDALMLIFLKDRLQDTSVIIGLAFVNIAMICVIIFTEVYSKTVNSYVYSVSSSVFAGTYFFIELVVAIVIIVVDPMVNDGWLHTLLYCIQPIMFLIFIILMIMNTSVNFQSMKVDKETAKRRNEFNSVLYPALDKAMAASKGKPYAKTVEKAYDEVRSLPADSNAASKSIDGELIALVDELNDAITGDDEAKVVAVCGRITDASDRKRQAMRASQN